MPGWDEADEMGSELPESVVAERVSRIVAVGVVRPLSFPRRLRGLYAALGPGVLFWGRWELIATIAFVSLAVAGFASAIVHNAPELAPGLVAALSPLLLLGLSGVVEALDRMGPLGEIRRTCRYSGAQVAAFRLLCFGAVGTGFGLLVAILLQGASGGDTARLLVLAAATATATAAAQVWSATARTVWWTTVALPVGWLGLWLVLLTAVPAEATALLTGVPALLLAALAGAFGWLYVRRVRVLFYSVGSYVGVAGQ